MISIWKKSILSTQNRVPSRSPKRQHLSFLLAVLQGQDLTQDQTQELPSQGSLARQYLAKVASVDEVWNSLVLHGDLRQDAGLQAHFLVPENARQFLQCRQEITVAVQLSGRLHFFKLQQDQSQQGQFLPCRAWSVSLTEWWVYDPVCVLWSDFNIFFPFILV